MRIAVIGGGICGVGVAFELAKAGIHQVVLYDKDDYLGETTHTKTVNIDGVDLDIDLGFMFFNRVCMSSFRFSISPTKISFVL